MIGRILASALARMTEFAGRRLSMEQRSEVDLVVLDVVLTTHLDALAVLSAGDPRRTDHLNGVLDVLSARAAYSRSDSDRELFETSARELLSTVADASLKHRAAVAAMAVSLGYGLLGVDSASLRECIAVMECYAAQGREERAAVAFHLATGYLQVFENWWRSIGVGLGHFVVQDAGPAAATGLA